MDDVTEVPAAPMVPTVRELQLAIAALATTLRMHYGERSAVIIAIGIPNGSHDRFAAYCTGPCLTKRGLLHWAVPAIVKQMDEHITEVGDGR